MKKMILVLLIAFGVFMPLVLVMDNPSAFAQEAAESVGDGLDFLASEDEMPASFSRKANQDAENYISKKGWQLGRNSDGRYVAIGSSSIAGNPSEPSFQMKRRNAFTQAMIDAKRSIAQSFSQMVARETSHSYGEGDSAAADAMMSSGEKKTPEEIGVLDKVEMLLHAELDGQLKERGIEPDSEEAKEVIRESINKASFRDKISRMANAEVGALVVSKIYEDSGDVVVVATYSANTKKLAASMTGKGKAPSVRKRNPSKPTVSEWIQSMTTKNLYPSYGVQLTSDRSGNLVIISYGQAVAKTSSKMSLRNAMMAAETDADGYIRSFVGEAVAFKNAKDEAEKAAEYNAGVIETQLARVQKTSIDAIAGPLKLPGISTAKTWTTQDKRSNSVIAGVVRRWDISSAKSAISEASDFESVGASKGGQGVQGSSGTGSSASTSRSETFSGDSGSYGHESMESEDF